MRTTTRIFLVVLLACSLVGCESRTDRTDSGGVVLSISDFDGLPIGVSVNTAAGVGFVQIEEVTISNVIKDPTGVGSDLMNVELQSYEVVFTRADSGTRVPPRLVRGIFGVAPVNGTLTIEGLPVVDQSQLLNVPLSDLLFQNGGFDKETGSTNIKLNLFLRFFGRTLSGDEVETDPAALTIDFTP